MVELRQVPECPLVERVRVMIRECARSFGVEVDVAEVVGDYPSPTVLIDGYDVATGSPPGGEPSCRLDLPTPEQLEHALRSARSAQ